LVKIIRIGKNNMIIGSREPGNVRESGVGCQAPGTGLFDYDNDYDHDNE
jgi:hypothetical protein